MRVTDEGWKGMGPRAGRLWHRDERIQLCDSGPICPTVADGRSEGKRGKRHMRCGTSGFAPIQKAGNAVRPRTANPPASEVRLRGGVPRLSRIFEESWNRRSSFTTLLGQNPRKGGRCDGKPIGVP